MRTICVKCVNKECVTSAYHMRTICVPYAYHMRTKICNQMRSRCESCIPDAYQMRIMRTKCAQNTYHVYQMRTKCVLNGSKCVQDEYMMRTTCVSCVPNSYQMRFRCVLSVSGVYHMHTIFYFFDSWRIAISDTHVNVIYASQRLKRIKTYLRITIWFMLTCCWHVAPDQTGGLHWPGAGFLDHSCSQRFWPGRAMLFAC